MDAAPDRYGHAATVIAPLRESPEASAIFTDVDGTLAPIVTDPSAAAVPSAARELLERLAERFALVGCVSGRRASEVREMLGLDGLCYIGNHGFERILPGESAPRPDPALHDHAGVALAFVSHLDRDRLEQGGLRLEDKGPIQALHWRSAPDEEATEALAREIADDAVARGLVPHWGRKVLEIRPAVGIDKGTAIAELLEERRLEHCLYGGDDRTDAQAFSALRAMEGAGDLRSAVCVGIASPESPREISEEADVVVGTPEEFLALLRLLET